MKNIVTRSISGIVYIALIVICILAGWPFFLGLTSLFVILGIIEFTNISVPEKSTPMAKAILGLDCLGAIAISWIPIVSAGWDLRGISFACLYFTIAYFLIRFTATIFDLRPNAFRNAAKSVLCVIYMGLSMCTLNALYLNPAISSPTVVLLIFVMIWLNDTGAYCFGSTLGKRKLCERLSPKKSWEGFWGGMGCCIAFGAVCYFCFNKIGLGIASWLLLGALVSLFATWGDLFESMLKRSVGVKDSGNIIPGHGGILDRIDSLLFVAPAAFLLLSLISQMQ